MPEETTQPPSASGSQESKKQTVRISLPPKPAASPTIKIAVPPAGAAESSKAASTIKIPVPPKTAATGVGVVKPTAPVEKEAPPAMAEEAGEGATKDGRPLNSYKSCWRGSASRVTRRSAGGGRRAISSGEGWKP